MIRRVDPVADVERIQEIEAVAAHAPWSTDALRSTLTLRTTRAWVAELDGRLVGHLLASVVADVGEILTVAVRPQARRLGVGRALVGACVACWVEEGVTEGFLEVRASNVAAQTLYARTGWREVSRRSGYYADGEDAIVMRWERGC